jgi:hypothetical protein
MMESDPRVVLEEIDNQMRRLKDQGVVDYKKELLANNYPIIRMLTELLIEQRDRLEMAEGAIAEALTHMDSQILPELAAGIQMTLALGIQICQDVMKLEVWSEHKMPDELRATIQAFDRAAKQLSDDVSDVTLEAIDPAEMESAEPPPSEDDAVVDQALAGEETQ